MSEPRNPLSDFSTYSMHHVLAVFPNTNDAESTELKKSSGESGESVGSGKIIINDFVDDRFLIPSIIWKWDKYGAAGSSTTSLEGLLEIADRTGGKFIDWFRNSILKEMKMSTDHLTFSLKTFFVGKDKRTDTNEVITGNPLIFHVHNLRDIMNIKGKGTVIRLAFTAAYNTTAQSPTVCKPYQMLLTHKSGGLENVDPDKGVGTGSIDFRGKEDGSYSTPRKDRLDKSKPMRTLKEAMDAFETALNQQAECNTSQVQTWLSEIRNNYVKKIDPPKHERDEKLPVTFEVKLDSVYHNYKIDNRNLPFEQTEERPEETKGVTCIPFRAGATIVEMVDTIMKYSIKVGEDAAKDDEAKTYSTNLSYIITKDKKISIKLKIKQITIPYTTQEFGDTGAGEGAVAPLKFTFKSPRRDDVDILYLKTDINSDAGIKPLEKPFTEGEKKPLVIYGNRETQTGERIPKSAPGTKFFDSGYSGLRLPIAPYLNSGLENAEAAANIDISKLIKNIQRSNHEIEIVGNPYLMFDLHRLPSEAAELESPGSAQYYKIPESYPMYLSIDIFLKADAVIGLTREQEPPEKFFYTKHYEIFSITNNMTNGAFYQNIMLKKTDDII